MSNNELPRGLKNPSYELFMLLLSLLSLINIAILVLPSMNSLIQGLILIMDIPITMIFMADFMYRLLTAESKREYFLRDWGWADLLASVPVGQLKIFRIFRVLKAGRLLSIYGVRAFARHLQQNRAGGALFLTVFLVMLVLEFGGALIVAVEAGDPQANITTPGDGVWWAFVTITTVGYGDQYPITEMGRLVGLFTMALGVGLFGVLTGFLANAFIPSRAESTKKKDSGKRETSDIQEFMRLLEEQERLTASLKAKLAHIEAERKSESS